MGSTEAEDDNVTQDEKDFKHNGRVRADLLKAICPVIAQRVGTNQVGAAAHIDSRIVCVADCSRSRSRAAEDCIRAPLGRACSRLGAEADATWRDAPAAHARELSDASKEAHEIAAGIRGEKLKLEEEAHERIAGVHSDLEQTKVLSRQQSAHELLPPPSASRPESCRILLKGPKALLRVQSDRPPCAF